MEQREQSQTCLNYAESWQTKTKSMYWRTGAAGDRYRIKLYTLYVKLFIKLYTLYVKLFITLYTLYVKLFFTLYTLNFTRIIKLYTLYVKLFIILYTNHIWGTNV